MEGLPSCTTTHHATLVLTPLACRPSWHPLRCREWARFEHASWNYCSTRAQARTLIRCSAIATQMLITFNEFRFIYLRTIADSHRLPYTFKLNGSLTTVIRIPFSPPTLKAFLYSFFLSTRPVNHSCCQIDNFLLLALKLNIMPLGRRTDQWPQGLSKNPPQPRSFRQWPNKG